MSGCTMYALCSVRFVLPDRFSVCILVRRIGESCFLFKQDHVYYAVQMYHVPIEYGSNVMAKTGLLYRLIHRRQVSSGVSTLPLSPLF